MTRGTQRLLLPLVFAALAVAGTLPAATAAEITGQNGIVTLVYDDAMWSAQHDNEGDPEITCTSAACGGNTAACGAVTVRPGGAGLSEDAFLGSFRQNLGSTTLESARTNASSAELVASPTVTEFGGNTGIALSIMIDFDDVPTRIDYFWLQAGPDLAGITCLVAAADHDAARSAFETIFADLEIRAP